METDEVATAFAALGQATRLELLRSLLAAGPRGMAAGDIATAIGVSPSTLSFHLRGLEQAGLIVPTRQGRSLIYAAQLVRLRTLLAFLLDACGDHAIDPLSRSPAMSPSPFNVLFLCTRNSARSIMAEAILTKMAHGQFVAHSAGSEPAAEGPLPEVLAQLKALGHDVSRLRSKSWDEFTGPDAPRMDFVIALCDITAGQVCPDFGTTTVTAAWPLPDPARFNGSAAERATLLNELYAGLRRRLEVFIALPMRTLGSIALQARIDELADPHLKRS
jgi:ArsR family transcriptional regulator, arsenate/arsenite/antimonite-responsive transcriptional repressor / arsenate reductase (thioredoxin)